MKESAYNDIYTFKHYQVYVTFKKYIKPGGALRQKIDMLGNFHENVILLLLVEIDIKTDTENYLIIEILDGDNF